MLQEEIALQRAARQPAPVFPTFVLCLGHFGEEVGKQFVARSMLMEESLKRNGLASSLLVQQRNEDETPGFLRVMHVDWDQWFSEQYNPDAFLRDIIIPLGSAEDGTRPWQCEKDRPPYDWEEARQSLRRPGMRTLLSSASAMLCTHDTPMRLGHYQTHDRSMPLGMRLIVVCAAREAASAEIGPDLIKLLGDVYIKRNALVKGIQIICSVGHTGLNEHRHAGGDEQEFETLLQQELARIVPENRRTMQSPNRSFVERMNDLWLDEPQIVESCYLLDSQLSNNVSPVKQRPDEPDEVVVAAALAINLFVASDADHKVRQQLQQRSASQEEQKEFGPFATFGISACSLDHPRLHQLVYSRLAGLFLLQVHPVQQGDDQAKMLTGSDKERLVDEHLEDQIVREVGQLCRQYPHRITFSSAQQPPLAQLKHGQLDYQQAVARLLGVSDYHSHQLENEVTHIAKNMLDDIEEGSLVELTKERQQGYVELLDKVFRDTTAALYEEEQASLTRLYRFTQQSLHALRNEVNQEQAPPAHTNLAEARRGFAKEQKEDFESRLIERIQAIHGILTSHPNQAHITLRVLLCASAFSLFGIILSLLPQVRAWFHTIPFFSTITPPVLGVMGFLALALLLWCVLTPYYRWHRDRRLRSQLHSLVQEHEKILHDADRKAWQLALTEQLEQQERETARIARLCQPGEMLAQLRSRFLRQQFTARDSVLERIFFDEQIQAKMEKAVQKLADGNKLCTQHQALLHELLNADWRDPHDLERWFQKKMGEFYQRNSSMIGDLLGNSMHDQARQHLSDVLSEMVNAAALFLHFEVSGQDNLTVTVQIFSIHNAEDFPDLEALLQNTGVTGVEILNNIDHLRWIFTHIEAGLNLEQIRFVAERFLTEEIP